MELKKHLPLLVVEYAQPTSPLSSLNAEVEEALVGVELVLGILEVEAAVLILLERLL